MKRYLASLVLSIASFAHAADRPSFAKAPEGRPNILWITAEDMSPTLGCYGDAYAISPNIDALAKRGVRYTHAFATAPVCSPSRSCIINGLPATSQGTMQMRSAFPIPESMTATRTPSPRLTGRAHLRECFQGRLAEMAGTPDHDHQRERPEHG